MRTQRFAAKPVQSSRRGGDEPLLGISEADRLIVWRHNWGLWDRIPMGSDALHDELELLGRVRPGAAAGVAGCADSRFDREGCVSAARARPRPPATILAKRLSYSCKTYGGEWGIRDLPFFANALNQAQMQLPPTTMRVFLHPEYSESSCFKVARRIQIRAEMVAMVAKHRLPQPPFSGRAA